MFSFFVPKFSATADRTPDGRVIYSVAMSEFRTGALTAAAAMSAARAEGYRAPIVGPSSNKH